MNKKVFLILSCLCMLSSVFAARKDKIDKREVSSMDSWQEDFDIDNKKAGKYNILVEVEDKGGNKTLGGPYNIYIDPDSDYPVSSITNPINDMRVPGNLNIVGTCIDDDGVDEVYLSFDGAESVKAEGKEFWSYYLDTTNLEEGPHTISVYGIDINGLSSQGKVKKNHTVTWNLDRRLPVTEVTNLPLGTLVSGKISLKGTVADGNGIKSLQYSLDGRENFYELKLNENKKTGVCTFDLPINTKDYKDGATVCWFKATDKMGSVGYNSFLYFVDNTKPDVKIISPAEKEVANGKFGVAGFAKDVIGIQKLTWECNGQSGEFELTPGNPYWYKEVDTIGLSKSVEFIVSATDTAGNISVAKRTIPLDQEADKPVVAIQSPLAESDVESEKGSLFVRGIATDDDGVSSIEYSLDGGEKQIIETHGVFYAPLNTENDLPYGKHTITVCATDIYGVKGNPVTVSFNSKGNVPSYSKAKIESSLGSADSYTGIIVHSESNPFYATTVSSDSGISSVSYKIEWGQNGIYSSEIPLKAPQKSVDVKIPLSSGELPFGALKLTVTSSDIYNRVSEQIALVKIRDLTKIEKDSPAVIFDDSRISENGDITNDVLHPVSGYFAGGKIKSASIVPQTPFATIQFNENTITLNATDSLGTSAPVKVRVVSEDDIVYESRELVFHSDSPAPVVAIDNGGEDFAFDGNENITVKGKVSSQIPVTELSYRIISVPALTTGTGYVTGIGSVSYGEFVSLPAKTGDFSFEIPSDSFGNGFFVIEVVANNGKKGAADLKVRKIPELPENGPDGKKKAAAAKPLYAWIDATDVHFVTVYQGETSPLCKTFLRSEMSAGNPELSVNNSSGKVVSKYTTKKEGNAKVFISSVAGNSYASGMYVTLPQGSSALATVSIVSDFPLTAINYSLEGEASPGGQAKQSGKVDLKSVRSSDSTHFEADIPLTNLPSGYCTINVTAETSNGSASYKGCVGIVREKDSSLIDNVKKIYWAPDGNIKFDGEQNQYILSTGTVFGAFANVYSPVKVSLASNIPGLSVTSDGTLISLVAEKEGVYKNVSVKVTDSQGVSYTSSSINLLVDDEKPNVEITAPELQKWVQKNTTLSVKAGDFNGIASVEYSLDGGASWNKTKVSDGVYSAALNFDSFEDGIIPVDVRARDISGKTSYAQTVIHKDTTPPVPQVILPCAEDIVNGENLIAFLVKDNFRFSKCEYIAPKTGNETVTPVEIPVGPMVVTHIGTKDKPINDLMIFRFSDEVGNVEQIRKWDFFIDAKSDLPLAEIHLPEENAVLTTDFTISGVVIDDDGPSKIWYKIDNEDYKLVKDEYATSFTIDVSLKDMTDNEHSVTVMAEDLNGVKGPEFVRNFKISLEEPKGQVVTPPISETVKGWVKLSGTADDKNGISKVFISVDNGNTFNEANGNFAHENAHSDWTYEFDSRVIQDGTHVVFLKIVDWFGIEGLYSSLINIDNTAPKINLELPLDDSKTSKMLFFSGQTTDNIGLENLYITIRSLEGKTVSQKLSRIDLEVGKIISQSIDLESLDNGFYNVELTGLDAANNITRVSRNIQLDKEKAAAKVDLLYPLNGESVQGVFNIYGTAVSEINIENLELLVDGQSIAETTISPSGYYKFNLTPEIIAEGQHKIQVKANLANVTTIISNEQFINYRATGPWVTIDNFTYGDFALERPYIVGNAGYAISEEELILSKTKGTSKEIIKSVEEKSVAKVELSFDNGKSFEELSTTGKWRYRVENEDIAEGYHFMLVRATMKNGEKALTRTIVQVDKTSPTVKLISPGEGGRYNQNLDFSGLATDNVALKSVTLALRKGDKSSYEVPSFIQGLYLDWHFWGATLFDIGIGLSFFDDNVRLQAQWGQFTQEQRNLFNPSPMRYGGDSIFGGKIIANVAYIPFMYFFGRDFEWLSANIAVGANFTRFNETASGKAQILSALIAQLEFPRVSFAKQKMFRTIAFYTEGQLWFIPTDVTSEVDIKNIVPQISIGLRVNVF